MPRNPFAVVDGTPQAPAAWTLPLIDTNDWILNEPPDRDWVVDQWLARGRAALLVGEDGIGKSLLAQQLCTCVSWGKPFLGQPVEKGPTLYVTCEDEPDELWRRQRAVNRAIGVPVPSAAPLLSSLVGGINLELGNYDEAGSFRTGPCFDGIMRTAQDRNVRLIVLDNVGHLFPGNENVRRDVASFVSALDRMAKECDAAVLLLAHPNKAGAEYSGSTGWSAYMRQRWFLERPESTAGIVDRDARIIRKSKANYAESGSEISFRWHQWAFVRDEDLGDDQRAEMAQAMQIAGHNALFLACLRAREAQGEGRLVGPAPGPNYAPTQFEGMPEAKGIKKHQLKAAMDRLFTIGAIEATTYRNKDKGRVVTVIREASPNTPNASPMSSRTLSPNVPEASPEHPRAHTVDTTYQKGAAQEAAAPSPEMILTPDERGDDVEFRA